MQLLIRNNINVRRIERVSREGRGRSILCPVTARVDLYAGITAGCCDTGADFPGIDTYHVGRCRYWRDPPPDEGPLAFDAPAYAANPTAYLSH